MRPLYFNLAVLAVAPTVITGWFFPRHMIPVLGAALVLIIPSWLRMKWRAWRNRAH